MSMLDPVVAVPKEQYELFSRQLLGCNDNDAILELVKANDGILSNNSVKMEVKRAIMLFLSCERHAYGF